MVPRQRLREKIIIMIKVILTVLTVCVFAGCQSEPPSKQGQEASQWIDHYMWVYTNGMAWPSNSVSPEIVMTPGMQITARTEKGEITIRAGEGFKRFYTWDGETRSATLWARNNRWLGSLDINYPGPGQHWKSNHGITRGVLEEGVLWFKTLDDALAWIERERSPIYPRINNSTCLRGRIMLCGQYAPCVCQRQ
jgi:hypothetical protein